jgi:HlyD family secretion protein
MTPRRTLITVMLIAAAAPAACRKPPERQTEAQQAHAVRVARLELRALTGALTASGDLVPREEAAVQPEVTGFRVDRVLVDEGAYVRAGQTLVQLDPALINAQLAQQTALAAQAAVQAEQAEKEAARVAGLDGQGVLSQEQIDQRRFQAKAARANANAQAAAARDVRARAAKLAVTAPVSGLVLQKNVRPGDLSAIGSEPWFRIARDGEIELLAQLSETDLAKVRPGQHVRVTLPSGGSADGVVRLVSPQVDAQTKLGAVRVRLPVRPDIRAGGFGRAVFTDAGAEVLAAPETAIRYDSDGAAVMVVGADNRVHRVLVQTGQRAGGYVQIVRGPPAGTRIVAAAGAFLLDGDLVRPVEGAAAVRAAPAAVPPPKPREAPR